MTRPSWDETFSQVAKIISERSTCSRRKVGAVLVRGNRIVATGYNGQPSGQMHCVDGGCPRGKLSFEEVPPNSDYNQFPCTAIHAEANAIIRAGHALTEGATIYVTELPCLQCSNLIQGADIARVVIMGR
jgi:dCMP deaminase